MTEAALWLPSSELTPLHPAAAEGVELVGLRGCRALRQALGVAGVRALDRLLEVRMIDGLQQLSSALTAPQTSEQLSGQFAAHAHGSGKNVFSQFVPQCTTFYTLTCYKACMQLLHFSTEPKPHMHTGHLKASSYDSSVNVFF